MIPAPEFFLPAGLKKTLYNYLRRLRGNMDHVKIIRSKLLDYELEAEKVGEYYHNKSLPQASWGDVAYLLDLVDTLSAQIKELENKTGG